MLIVGPVSWLFLAVSVWGFAFTVNAFVPQGNHKRWFIPSFLFSWLTMELAAHHLAWQAVATVVFVQLGALQAWPGWVGLGISALSWLGLVVLVLQGRRAGEVIARTLEGFVPHDDAVGIPAWRLLVPFPFRPAHVKRVSDVVYGRAAGRDLELDVFLPPTREARRPALVQIHGGGWIMGDKRQQGLPLLLHMADRGWVGFNVNYRLSPGATFPDHLVDVKRALAWIREHADDYGVDPDFVAVTGGSAGGHLAALVALTSDDDRYQPGFEGADVSVQACAPIYGVYDLANRLGCHRPEYVSKFIGPVVIKAFFEDEPEKFFEASPIDRVVADAPPFLVVHGDRDTMSPMEDAELFVERLTQTSEAPVLFARVPGAQHAFDTFLSPRSLPVVEGVGAFFDTVHRAYRERRAQHEQAQPLREELASGA